MIATDFMRFWQKNGRDHWQNGSGATVKRDTDG
jgi:hypothetical protein